MSLFFLVEPFVDYAFMRRAAAGCLALSFGSCPLGVFMVLRRLSLVGDAMSHAILPGVAIGFLVAGLSLTAMTIGGLATGFAVAAVAGLVSRATPLKEDASFAAFYLISLGLGVLIVSMRGSTVDLLHVLFGSVLALDDAALFLIAAVATVSVLMIAAFWRPFVIESLEPGFLAVNGGGSVVAHLAFVALIALNLVAGFNALGTLMAVGLMMLPAAAAGFWSENVTGQIAIAVAIGITASFAGLVASFHAGVPASPAIILAAGAAYLVSVVVGPVGGLVARHRGLAHAAAGPGHARR